MDVGMEGKLQMQEVQKPVIFLNMEIMGALIIAVTVSIGTVIIVDRIIKLLIQAVQSRAENLKEVELLTILKNDRY
jgi:hypothetical protein